MGSAEKRNQRMRGGDAGAARSERRPGASARLHFITATSRRGLATARMFGTALPVQPLDFPQGSSSTRSIVARQAQDVLRCGRTDGGNRFPVMALDTPRTGGQRAAAAVIARIMFLTLSSGRERFRAIEPVSQFHIQSHCLPIIHPPVLPATMGAPAGVPFGNVGDDDLSIGLHSYFIGEMK